MLSSTAHFSLLKPLLARLAVRLTPSKARLRLQESGRRLVEARRTHTSSPQVRADGQIVCVLHDHVLLIVQGMHAYT